MRLSVIIPVLNEAARLETMLQAVSAHLHEGDEMIVVDGCSQDDSALIASRHADLVLHCDRGRARQMNLGAERASGDLLWFLHADSQGLRGGHFRALRALPERVQWGRFDVRLGAKHPLLWAIGHAMNLRSRWTGIATGDQGIFVRHGLFTAVGGFPQLPLMEDVALSGLLRRHGAPACLRPALRADSRRWEEHGVWRTVFLMWRLRWRYWRGEDPARLHRDYYGDGEEQRGGE